jgi:hypothetical protein
MNGIRQSELNSAMRKCLAAPETPAGVLAAVAREMRRVRDLPFVEGDPSLAGDRVRELCRDLPGFAELLRADDCLGQVCQAINEPALAAAYRATARSGGKFQDWQIPAVTQLFTPGWVVAFLLHNTLGRAWLEMHPDSQLELPWLVERPSNEARALVGRPLPALAGDLKVLDPACGTMNFGMAAYDLLDVMYREEIDRAGRRGWPAVPSVEHEDQVPGAILRQNLFGTDIDAAVLDLARASLEMKLRRPVAGSDANLIRADALFDALPTKWPASFDVVVTNPPYLSARNLPVERVRRLKAAHPTAWRDGCACFFDLGLNLLRPGGRAGFLVSQSILFTGSYEPWRRQVIGQSALETFAHFGPGLFGVGNAGTLQTAGLTARREGNESIRDRQKLVALRVVEPTDPTGKRSALARAVSETRGGSAVGLGDRIFEVLQKDLASLPRGTWAYWAQPADQETFTSGRRLGTIASLRQGLATTDNARFVRYWWEVDPVGVGIDRRASPGRWAPYVKSGRFRQWYEAARHRVNWEDDGREIKASIVSRYPYLNGKWQWVAKNASCYGRGGITYSYLTSGRFSARRLEPGCVFDVAGSAIFPADEGRTLGVLAVLNSSSAARLLHVINPTLNFQVGDLAELPMPSSLPDSLCERVRCAIDLQQGIDRFDETSPDFVAPIPWAQAEEHWRAASRELRRLELEIDHQVAELYGLPVSAQGPTADEALDRAELARQWVSFAIGVELGRWGDPAAVPPAERTTVEFTWQRHPAAAIHRGGRPQPLLNCPSLGTSLGSRPGEPKYPANAVRLRPADLHWIGGLKDRLAAWVGVVGVGEISAAVGGLDDFVTRRFFPWHVQRFRRRPVYWMLGDSTIGHLLRHDQAHPELVRYVLAQCGASIPAGWDRHIDDGIINLAPLANWVVEPTLRRELKRHASDLAGGRYGWSNTARSYAGIARF